MTNDHKYWIRYKNKKYVVQKIIDGKQKQIADFPSRAQAKKYVTKHTVAAHLEKVVDKEYSFHELYLKFATEKQQGGRNIKTCITKSAGDRYMAHFEHYIKPNFEDCPVHTIGGAKMKVFITKLLDNGNKPELYKTTNLVLANLRRFFRWCSANQYHENFQSALAARIPEQFEPRDRKLRDKVKATVINPADAARLLQFVWEHREDDYKFSYACMIFHILFYFGFRRSEILGLKKSQINIAQGYVDVQGAWDSENNVYRTETKNDGSKRLVYFDPDGRAAEVLKWILDYSNKKFPASDYVVAATRGNNPLSNFMFRKVVYATYEQLGMAKIKWHKSNNSHKFTIISSVFKGCMSKTWRHLKAAQLIKDQHKLMLSDNYIKDVMGHDLIETTRGIYGDHDLLETEEHHNIAAKIEAARNKPIKLIN
jgi:integrase